MININTKLPSIEITYSLITAPIAGFIIMLCLCSSLLTTYDSDVVGLLVKSILKDIQDELNHNKLKKLSKYE